MTDIEMQRKVAVWAEVGDELYFKMRDVLFVPTHLHVNTGGLYMVTSEGRLEVTGDYAYSLVEYEDYKGEKFAQRADQFHDGRFEKL